MRNVLIIKLGALGDVVMATPLIDAIQRFHDGATVHVLTTPAFAPLFSHWPDIKVEPPIGPEHHGVNRMVVLAVGALGYPAPEQ